MRQKAPATESKTRPGGDSSSVLVFATVGGDREQIPVYWINYDPGKTDIECLRRALNEILIDAAFEEGLCCPAEERLSWREQWQKDGFSWWAEKQFLPGVTDNLGSTIEEALRLKHLDDGIKVASGQIYLFRKRGAEERKSRLPSFSFFKELFEYAEYELYHPLTETFRLHSMDESMAVDDLLTYPDVVLSRPSEPEPVTLELGDDELVELSKTRLLALTLEEMKAIKEHFAAPETRKMRAAAGLSELPVDIELEVLAQTWSEHCKHKIFNANIKTSEQIQRKTSPEGKIVSQEHQREIKSLYKTYIKGATEKLKERRDDLLSVFEDNSGVVRLNDDWGVCFKVETHNSPSALEPYGGALTGILGVNRDILGTGLGARPIFNTDVFCFASPTTPDLAMRPKLLPPETIPRGVRKGVEDGGNKSGIPTVNGSIFFDDGYRAKPLVFCGTGGLLPLNRDGRGLDPVFKHTSADDRIVMVGGRVGKDGIHGATFSSEALNEGSPVTAVQIGDPFTQKRVVDFILAAREKGLLTGITDNGAGGLSSSVGEMATITGGASIDLANVPLKYNGLSDWEIVVSESQERMTVSTNDAKALTELAAAFEVEVSDIGSFNDSGCFDILRDGRLIARLDLEFLHKGNPTLELEAFFEPPCLIERTGGYSHELSDRLLTLLGHPNICSREAVIRQYDHEVQGTSVIKPLMGEDQLAPCDAAVLKPLPDSDIGLVVSNGLTPQYSQYDAYTMAVLAVDEAIRNATCVGCDPDTISLLDNFCWPDPVKSSRNKDGDYKLGQLVRSCQGLYDACLAFGTPLISGKDSMKNDFDDGLIRLSIPPTLLISAIGKLPDIARSVSMEFKQEGDLIYLLTTGTQAFTGSHYSNLYGTCDTRLPSLDFKATPQMYRTIFELVQRRAIRSLHDLSEGGLGVSLAECMLGSRLGARVSLKPLAEGKSGEPQGKPDFILFSEGPGRILVTVSKEVRESFESAFSATQGVGCHHLGEVTAEPSLVVDPLDSAGQDEDELFPVDSNAAHVDVPNHILRHAWCDRLPVD